MFFSGRHFVSEKYKQKGKVKKYYFCRTLHSLSNPEIEETKPHNKYCIEKMYGVTVASDCIQRYLRRNPADVCALNLSAIVLERENVLKSAKEALELALKLQETYQDGKKIDILRGNLGRVCHKMALYDEAITHFSAVKDRDFTTLCGLALALEKNSKLEECYGTYLEALNEAKSPTSRSHVLTAMASIAFRFQGSDAAQTLLFQGSQIKPPSVRGLFALCVLGVKKRDKALINAALKEMATYADEPDHAPDVASLEALVVLLTKKDAKMAQRTICKYVHKFPYLSSLWSVLATHSLMHLREDPRSVARCAEKANGLARISKVKTSETMLNLVSLSLLLRTAEKGAKMSKESVMTSTEKELKSAAAQSVHRNPESASAWAMMLAAALVTRESTDKLRFLAARTKGLLKTCGDNNMTDWIANLIKLAGEQ